MFKYDILKTRIFGKTEDPLSWAYYVILFAICRRRMAFHNAHSGAYFPYLLRVCAKLRKTTVIFAMSVRPSVRLLQLGSHWTDFHEIWYVNIFENLLRKVKFLSKSDMNKGYFT
jgi:hypothetical protein